MSARTTLVIAAVGPADFLAETSWLGERGSVKTKAISRTCAVCRADDERMLVEMRLGREDVILCGSHALMHRRSREQAKTVAELCALVSDRRGRIERRGDDDRRLGEIDALGIELTAAFAGERRVSRERRKSA
jgi:hypothetical protein